jgi:hypothetical protein
MRHGAQLFVRGSEIAVEHRSQQASHIFLAGLARGEMRGDARVALLRIDPSREKVGVFMHHGDCFVTADITRVSG